MKHRYLIPLFSAVITAGAFLYIYNKDQSQSRFIIQPPEIEENEFEEEDRDLKMQYIEARRRYEYDIIKDPKTGRIPNLIFQRELALARSIATKDSRIGSGTMGANNLNNYVAAGPDSIGGRTRALAIDKRYNGTSNRVILAGSVSSGIMRSSDGGNNWTRVSPENDIHNVTSIAQDTRPGFENTWYAGGGEPIGNSASEDGASYLGHGIWKSTDNGITWTKLPLIVNLIGGGALGAGSVENFDNPFDFVHRIVVHPTTGDVYVAGHRRLVRSTNGGQTWNEVFTTVKPLGSSSGQIDIAISTAGRLFMALNGGAKDRNLRGVWTSTTGAANSWTRIAGGRTLGVDSVAGWRANSYSIEGIDNNPFPPDTTWASKRIILALAPSNQNLLYVLYENGLDQGGSNPKPEVDLFKLDYSGANTWTNLSANMPDFPGQLEGVDPIETQGGFNLTLAVKPDDPNTVFIGATNLFRSTSGFTNTTATSWIAGYGQDFTSGLKIYPNSHPDIHALAFFPNNNGFNPNFEKAICGNDGGLQITDDIMQAGSVEPVTWKMVRNYQTLQYYHIALDATPNQNNFIGGAQDNGTQVRGDGDNNHIRIISGDGGAAYIGKLTNTEFTLYGSTQLGSIYRYKQPQDFKEITPTNLTPFPGLTDAYGDFVTYYKMDFDNQENIYYVNFNRLFRTTNASTVTSSGWTELTGVGAKVNPSNPNSGTGVSIRTLETTRGPYNSSHALYIGTSNGKVFRLDDPKNAPSNTSPADITPPVLESFRTSGAAVNISDIAVNPNNDNEIMVVVSNYSSNGENDFNIWWTNNAKAASPTWKKAEGNLTLPSVRSCAIVVKKNGNNSVTEYYVGTSVGLYSSLDVATTNTPTWVREGGNILNYSVITALDYRPQDNVLLVGTHGNGAYIAEIGSPDYRPNQSTGINDPVRNDKNFISLAAPSVTDNKINFTIGNMFTIKRMIVRVNNLSGQQLIRQDIPYANGQVNVSILPKGAYILTITSNDNKQQFVMKFLRK